jgi:hypothetical protein
MLLLFEFKSAYAITLGKTHIDYISHIIPWMCNQTKFITRLLCYLQPKASFQRSSPNPNMLLLFEFKCAYAITLGKAYYPDKIGHKIHWMTSVGACQSNKIYYFLQPKASLVEKLTNSNKYVDCRLLWIEVCLCYHSSRKGLPRLYYIGHKIPWMTSFVCNQTRFVGSLWIKVCLYAIN